MRMSSRTGTGAPPLAAISPELAGVAGGAVGAVGQNDPGEIAVHPTAVILARDVVVADVAQAFKRFARRDVQLLAPATAHPVVNARAIATRVPGGQARFQRQVELAHAPRGSPFAQQRADRRMGGRKACSYWRSHAAVRCGERSLDATQSAPTRHRPRRQQDAELAAHLSDSLAARRWLSARMLLHAASEALQQVDQRVDL